MIENESEGQLNNDVPLSTFATQNEGVAGDGDAVLKPKITQKTQEEKFQETMAQQQTLMTQQQLMINNLLRALERTATQTSSSTVSRIDFKLVQYDPDDSPYSMSEWLELATKSKIRYNMSDEEMIMKVGEALQKRGAKHFRQWKPRVRDWQSLVNDLTCSFPVVGTPFSRLSAVTTTRSSDCESLAAFCNRKLREIRAIYEVEFPWSFILGIIEGCCDDNELRVTIRLHQPSTEASLIILAGERDNDIQRNQKEAHSRTEKHLRPSRYEPYARNNHNKSTNKFMGICHSCNQLGHKSYECKSKSKTVSTLKPQVQDGREKESSNACSHCKKFGHTVDKCYFKVGFPNKTSKF